MREACKRLAQAGLVRAVPHRGYYVRDLDRNEIDDLYEVRVALETFAVTLAVERGRTMDWSSLAREWATPLDPLPAAEVMLELDEKFHIALAEAGGNTVLVEHLLTINERIRAIRAKDFALPGRSQSTCDQHAWILGLIIGGDDARASAAMREHIMESKASAIHAVRELLASVYLQRRRGAR
jgi:DNA-binding GntR family transcriptional regulator